MTHTKVSVSLSVDDLAYLDQQTRSGAFASRSGAMHEAIRLLRESRLADAYASAFREWEDSDDSRVWDHTAGDGS